ncbi:MAG: DHA2 family efflux MFS transporter permease subunit [Chloroflexota bacterium]
MHHSLAAHHLGRNPHIAISIGGRSKERRATVASRNPFLALGVLCLGFFMTLLDLTVVNIAIPSLSRSLGATLDQVLWVINAYTLVLAVLLILAGRLGDRFGQRRLFVIGLAVFVLASAGCGIAQTIDQLIAFRALQGVGGALLSPQTMALLIEIFPPDRRGAAFGIWGATAGLASVAGPAVGGLLISHFDWRWIFYVNVPLGVLAIVLTLWLVPAMRPGTRAGLDPVGVLLVSGGLVALLFGLTEGERYRWGVITAGITIDELITAGVVLLAAFVVWEWRRPGGLMPLHIFSDRNYSLMVLLGAIVSFAVIGFFLPLSIFLQSILGMSALQAGLTVAPLSMTSMFAAPVAGHLADRYGAKYVLAVGVAAFGIGIALVAYAISETATWSNLLVPMVLTGIGFGSTFAPMAGIAMRDVPYELAGTASGVLNTIRQVGSALGGAIVGAVLQVRLSAGLRDHAADSARQLPPAARKPFQDAFADLVRRGVEVGSTSLSTLPPDLPPDLRSQMLDLARQVFGRGYADGLRGAYVVIVALMLVGAIACVLVRQRSQLRDATAPAPVVVGQA